MRFTKDEGLRKYFADKKVVLIGPAPYLTDRKLGAMFDDYDIICRINEIFPVNQKEDYGSRTDVGFLNCATEVINDYIYKMNESPEIAINMKYIICPVIKAQHDWLGSVRVNCGSINIYNIPSYFIEKEDYAKIYNLIGVEPNSGMVSTLMLLYLPIRELLVTGITFYSEFVNTVKGSLYNIFYHKNHTIDSLQLKDFNPHGGHNQPVQKEFYKHVVLKTYKDKLYIDSYLQNLLNITYDKVVIV